MKALFNSIDVKIIYALRSFKFWAAVAIYLSLLIFYSYTGQIYQTRQGLYYLLHYALQMSSREFLLMACALPAAGLFAEEWCSGRFVSSYIRTKKLPHAFSIILSSFAIAALVCVFACTAYIGVSSITHPFTGDPAKPMFIHMAQKAFANGGLMLKGHYFAYYSIAILTEACYMGIFTAISVVISLVITNSYIAVVSPMIVYIMIGTIPFPILLSLRNIYGEGNYIIRILDPDNKENFSPIAMIYPFVFAGIILVILSFISYFLIKRKYEKNSDLR